MWHNLKNKESVDEQERSAFTVKYGFAHDKEKGKPEKTLYHVKIITARLNSVPGGHHIIESTPPEKPSDISSLISSPGKPAGLSPFTVTDG
ncbi:hypothetical protein QUF80_17640 [Desulfococcaceae bacterium HSG8]|nr:hypothetical protein [Desulfococcaceae bacterium HSG8]